MVPLSWSGKLVPPVDAEWSEEVSLVLNRDPAWDRIRVPVGTGGEFRITGLSPEVYEIKIISSRYELDPERLRSPQWTTKSVKRAIEESVDHDVIPVRPIAGLSPERVPDETQTVSGRVTDSELRGLEGLQVDASDSLRSLRPGLARESDFRAMTRCDGGFVIRGIPATRVWLKLYRPDEDGMRFHYLGMVEAPLPAEGLTIPLGPAAESKLDSLTDTVD